MSLNRILAVCALACGAAHAARAELVDVVVDGAVLSNDVLDGPFVGVAPGAHVRLSIRIDTADVFSDEPENFTTWYFADYASARFAAGDGPVAQGLPESVPTQSVVAFSGGDVYYQVDIPTVYLALPQPTLLHCEFDGEHHNPFNNTGRLEENLGVYDARVFDRLQYFVVSVAHVGPPLSFRDMIVGAQTFTFLRACPADLDGDGVVSGADLALLLGSWGTPGAADLDGDGAVGSADLASLLGAWGGCP